MSRVKSHIAWFLLLVFANATTLSVVVNEHLVSYFECLVDGGILVAFRTMKFLYQFHSLLDSSVCYCELLDVRRHAQIQINLHGIASCMLFQFLFCHFLLRHLVHDKLLLGLCYHELVFLLFIFNICLANQVFDARIVWIQYFFWKHFLH